MALNKTMIIGNLGADPEIRYTQGGKAVANITIATTEKWKDRNTGEAREDTEWHRVVFFDRQAEVIGEHCRKGSKLFVEGALKTRKWQDKDGKDRYTTEIRGRNFELLGGRSDDQPSNPARHASGNKAQANPTYDKAPPPPDGGDFFDDDIPF